MVLPPPGRNPIGASQLPGLLGGSDVLISLWPPTPGQGPTPHCQLTEERCCLGATSEGAPWLSCRKEPDPGRADTRSCGLRSHGRSIQSPGVANLGFRQLCIDAHSVISGPENSARAGLKACPVGQRSSSPGPLHQPHSSALIFPFQGLGAVQRASWTGVWLGRCNLVRPLSPSAPRMKSQPEQGGPVLGAVSQSSQ